MDKEIHTGKLGRDLTLKIPQTFAAQLGLGPDSNVDLSLLGNSIIICPAQKPPLLLEDLLAKVTDSNLHDEVDFGPPIGKELW